MGQKVGEIESDIITTGICGDVGGGKTGQRCRIFKAKGTNFNMRKLVLRERGARTHPNLLPQEKERVADAFDAREICLVLQSWVCEIFFGDIRQVVLCG